MTTYKKLSGECLCGNVSWSMKGPFDFFGLCQCSLCRKLTGSGFASNLFVKFDQFQWIVYLQKQLCLYCYNLGL